MEREAVAKIGDAFVSIHARVTFDLYVLRIAGQEVARWECKVGPKYYIGMPAWAREAREVWVEADPAEAQTGIYERA